MFWASTKHRSRNIHSLQKSSYCETWTHWAANPAPRLELWLKIVDKVLHMSAGMVSLSVILTWIESCSRIIDVGMVSKPDNALEPHGATTWMMFSPPFQMNVFKTEYTTLGRLSGCVSSLFSMQEWRLCRGDVCRDHLVDDEFQCFSLQSFSFLLPIKF